MEYAVGMFMPAHAGAGAKGFSNPWNRCERAQSHFERAGQICRTVFGRQRECLFFIQAELIGLLIVRDVASRSL